MNFDLPQISTEGMGNSAYCRPYTLRSGDYVADPYSLGLASIVPDYLIAFFTSATTCGISSITRSRG